MGAMVSSSALVAVLTALVTLAVVVWFDAI
jgi:hypothetical protein